MKSKVVSLFDEVQIEVNRDIFEQIQKPFSPLQNIGGGGSWCTTCKWHELPGFPTGAVVHYTSGRTGREAFMSASRYYAIASLQPGLNKRYIGPTADLPENRKLAEGAVLEFLEDNERCRSFNKSYDPNKLSSFVSLVRGEIMLLLKGILDRYVSGAQLASDLVTGCTTGPGSSSGSQSSGWYEKLFSGPLTYSSEDILSLYKFIMKRASRLFADAETVRHSLYGCDDSIAYAKFSSVPKTNEKERGICSQAILNMFTQLGLNFSLCRVLRICFDCDLETQQDKNRELAWLGTVGPHGEINGEPVEFVTVDMSRASNFPLCVIEDLFSDTLVLKFVLLLRSPYMVMPDKSIVDKQMCSTMGNGFTFSLMTLYFSAIVKTLYTLADLPEYGILPSMDGTPPSRKKLWAVYGDDIIVEKRVYAALLQVADAFGLIINTKKTHSESSFTKAGCRPVFRESCGADFYDGYNVRPVFLETLNTQADIFSILNRLSYWGFHHSIDLPHVTTLLRSRVTKDNDFRIPNTEDVCHGWHVPHSYALNSPFDKKVVTPPGFPVEMTDPQMKGRFYEHFTPVSRKRPIFHIKKGKIRTIEYSCVMTKQIMSYKMAYSEDAWIKDANQTGALISGLEGHVENGKYGIRFPDADTEYVKTWSWAPGWGDPTLISGTVRWNTSTANAVYRLWEEYVRRNSEKLKKLI